mmetsp:Transcript_69830/g.202605  ORF Transcript_69830/g.202605 Transcript_69830/m.202605 type:complete len:612 (+) Transcript_69830:86-1921(+)
MPPGLWRTALIAALPLALVVQATTTVPSAVVLPAITKSGRTSATTSARFGRYVLLLAVTDPAMFVQTWSASERDLVALAFSRTTADIGLHSVTCVSMQVVPDRRMPTPPVPADVVRAEFVFGLPPSGPEPTLDAIRRLLLEGFGAAASSLLRLPPGDAASPQNRDVTVVTASALRHADVAALTTSTSMSVPSRNPLPVSADAGDITNLGALVAFSVVGAVCSAAFCLRITRSHTRGVRKLNGLGGLVATYDIERPARVEGKTDKLVVIWKYDMGAVSERVWTQLEPPHCPAESPVQSVRFQATVCEKADFNLDERQDRGQEEHEEHEEGPVPCKQAEAQGELYPAFGDGAVQYFSATHRRWVTARLRVGLRNFAGRLRIQYTVLIPGGRVQRRQHVPLSFLRPPLLKGEAVEVYLSADGVWHPAIVLGRVAAYHRAERYTVTLWRTDGGGGQAADRQDDSSCALVREASSHHLRRRLVGGERVRVYAGETRGWRQARVALPRDCAGGSSEGRTQRADALLASRAKEPSAEEDESANLTVQPWTRVPIAAGFSGGGLIWVQSYRVLPDKECHAKVFASRGLSKLPLPKVDLDDEAWGAPSPAAGRIWKHCCM